MKHRIGLFSLIMGTVVCFQPSFGAVPVPPVVSNVKMVQGDNRTVTITYDISNVSGIVTLDIQTNGVSIGAENIQYLGGDVNKEVEIGTHRITWSPEKSWPGHKVDQVTAKVCAWEKSAPPDYMTVNLITSETNWYTCANALPEGIGSDRYRGNYLLMRKIGHPNGGKWVMGSPLAEPGRTHKIEALHEVTLTNDYWIGVFEVTQKQWELVKGDRPAEFKGFFRPIEKVSYGDVRGEKEEFYYPNQPDPNSFLGKLQKKTNLPFDLPSEMQWEYACRAGTDTAYNNGKDNELAKIGRYKGNGGAQEKHARVGSYQPNAWGLYDMHGNVWEWCLDWYSEDISSLDGRVVTEPDNNRFSRIQRGGSWFVDTPPCRSASRGFCKPTTTGNSLGFRLCCPAGL